MTQIAFEIDYERTTRPEQRSVTIIVAATLIDAIQLLAAREGTTQHPVKVASIRAIGEVSYIQHEQPSGERLALEAIRANTAKHPGLTS